MNSVKKDARVAGFLYLLLVPLGFYGPGAAGVATTANKILASASLFRLSIASSLLVPIVTLFLALALYKLLRAVDRNMALLMVVFVVIAAPIAMLNELNRFAALLLSSNPGYMTAFTREQSQALVTLFLELNRFGIAIAGIFWGLWLFPLGYLVVKSTYIPRILGILLVVAGFGYVIESFATFFISGYGGNISDFTFWGELFFLLYLLIRGVNVERWGKRALAYA